MVPEAERLIQHVTVIPAKPARGGSASALTLSELQQYLARAADLLRGSIDQADFKAYIFPLMLFNRISDV